MNALMVIAVSALALYLGYRFYASFISERILGLSEKNVTPAVAQEDGMDFVPTRRVVLFGHHFASIAGLGPIAGPAIAVVWGWLPALLWVIIGAIFIGAVHDLSTLATSLRHKAATIGDLTRKVIGPRAQILFLILIFFVLALAMGVFALLMAKLFTNLSPEAVIPTFSLVLIAMIIGTLVYRMKWNLTMITIGGLVAMFAMLFVGAKVPVPAYRMFVTDQYARGEIQAHPELVRGQDAVKHFDALAKDKTGADAEKAGAAGRNVADAVAKTGSSWTCVLLAYAFIASVLPVWLLLQPRDYINSFLLYAGLIALVAGFVVANPQLAMDRAVNASAKVNGPWLPFLFITVACGAVSGFHSLVSSGTTARQLRTEIDAKPVGYGSMLVESFLAVLVIFACVTGLSGEKFAALYQSGAKITGGAGLGGFLSGAGNTIAAPFKYFAGEQSHASIVGFCKVFMSVVVVSFAMTTLDSGTRLLRYDVEALGRLLPGKGTRKLLGNRAVSSLIAVLAIAGIALMKLPGKGGKMMSADLTIWQLFGTTNQLLAALGLLIVSVYLWVKRKPVYYTLIPMAGMLVVVVWAMAIKIRGFHAEYNRYGDVSNLSLIVLSYAIVAMAAWICVEAAFAFTRKRGPIE